MNPNGKFFQDCLDLVDWCQSNDIRSLPKQIDQIVSNHSFNYNQEQADWLDSFYKSRSYQSRIVVPIKKISETSNDLANSGRACCGGRQVCVNGNQRNREYFVENKFPNWHCSVNEFFLNIKQVNGEIFVNKDCKMNFQQQVGPIGTLDKPDELLEYTRKNLQNKTLPIIRCKKHNCICGLCAPKAKELVEFQTIMEKYHI